MRLTSYNVECDTDHRYASVIRDIRPFAMVDMSHFPNDRYLVNETRRILPELEKHYEYLERCGMDAEIAILTLYNFRLNHEDRFANFLVPFALPDLDAPLNEASQASEQYQHLEGTQHGPHYLNDSTADLFNDDDNDLMRTMAIPSTQDRCPSPILVRTVGTKSTGANVPVIDVDSLPDTDGQELPRPGGFMTSTPRVVTVSSDRGIKRKKKASSTVTSEAYKQDSSDSSLDLTAPSSQDSKLGRPGRFCPKCRDRTIRTYDKATNTPDEKARDRRQQDDDDQ